MIYTKKNNAVTKRLKGATYHAYICKKTPLSSEMLRESSYLCKDVMR